MPPLAAFFLARYSCGMICRCAIPALALLGCLSTSAWAGDAAARNVIGFSPDGGYFAFEQYTMVYEDEASFSEYVIVDTKSDTFVPGAPIRILIRGDDGLDEKKARADAQAKAKPAARSFQDRRARHAHRGQALDGPRRYRHLPDQPAADGEIARYSPARRAQGADRACRDHPIATVMCDGHGRPGHARQGQGFWRQADAQDRGWPADGPAARQGAAQEPPLRRRIRHRRSLSAPGAATAPSPSPR